RKIQIGLQVWNLFAECGQIMRAADLPAHRTSGGISVKMLQRSILTDSQASKRMPVFYVRNYWII
ncbi:MAG: hypothetical protein IJA67_06435, partial [Oscillospiraceae bacterium]|nr:hypothetical protein [Oscillospiraceae bacterium]